MNDVEMTLAPDARPFERAPFLTIDEVRAYLRVNVRTVYRMIRSGRLPAVRVGRQWRVRPADLDAWLAGLQNEASSEIDRSERNGGEAESGRTAWEIAPGRQRPPLGAVARSGHGRRLDTEDGWT
jgi:excisionase family DNA binding protein